MADSNERGESLENISLAAAMANSYARDQNGFAGLIAALLEASLPGQTQVERKPIRLFSQEKRVAQVTVTLGDEIYDLADPGHDKLPVATIQRIVRGITLKNERVGIDEWLRRLGDAIAEHAKHNQYASAAIMDYMRKVGL